MKKKSFVSLAVSAATFFIIGTNISLNISLVFMSACLASCTMQHKESFDAKYGHEDFKETKALKGACIKLPSSLSPREMYVVRDSFVLATNNNPGQKYKVALFSMNDWRCINEFARIGHAKGEYIDCGATLHGDGQSMFYLTDAVQNYCAVCSIDSLMNGGSCAMETFNYSRGVIDFYPLTGQRYVGFDMWHLSSGKYANEGTHAVDLYDVHSSTPKRQNKYKNFVANVTGGTIFENPNNHDIWVAYRYDNRIEIYDSQLQLKKAICGPSDSQTKYVGKEERGATEVLQSSNSYTSCFGRCAVTKNHVYLIYENQNNTKRTEVPRPVEVLKFDWNGNPISNYQLDKFAYTISVDSKEQNLYATCCDSYTGDIQFVKYAL